MNLYYTCIYLLNCMKCCGGGLLLVTHMNLAFVVSCSVHLNEFFVCPGAFVYIPASFYIIYVYIYYVLMCSLKLLKVCVLYAYIIG